MSDELDRLITQWAARHAPELITQAQADALELARERLRARLADALLAAAEARLTSAAEPPPPAEERLMSAAEATPPAEARLTQAAEPPPHAESGSLVWLYGVVPAGAEPVLGEGVDSHPVRLHRHAGVAALVSDVPTERFGEEAIKARLEQLDALEALARAHEGVLQSALDAGAVVPFRLCTIYSSPDRLDAMLDREALSLTAALDRLDGMQEWGVKAFLNAPTPVAAGESAASGTEYLSRKRERREAAEEGREAAETVVAAVHARLAEGAAAATLSRPQDRRLSGRESEMVMNAAYLVPANGADAFRAIVEALGQRHEADGVELELTGPWPPHHFVETPRP